MASPGCGVTGNRLAAGMHRPSNGGDATAGIERGSSRRVAAISLPSARLLSRNQAAGYCGISPGHFDRMVAEGILPSARRLGGRVVWDRVALDVAIDSLMCEDSGNEPNPWDD